MGYLTNAVSTGHRKCIVVCCSWEVSTHTGDSVRGKGSQETMVNDLLPNLIIAGASRSGSTSLFSYLSLHPDICPSGIKETCYFVPLRYGRELPPVDQYLQHFTQCGHRKYKYIMEGSAGYIYGGKNIAQAIRALLGNVRVIFILRDPIKRALSNYKFFKSRMALDRGISFAEYVSICEMMPPDASLKREDDVYWGIQGGLYISFLSAWFDTFGGSARVVFFEHLKDDPRQLLRDLCEWLGIDHAVFDTADLGTENQGIDYRNKLLQQVAVLINDRGESYWRAHPHLKQLARRIYYAINGRNFDDQIADGTMAYLQSAFKPYNRQLAIELLERGYTDLPGWLAKELEDRSVHSLVEARSS